jgi:hypothetical protein
MGKKACTSLQNDFYSIYDLRDRVKEGKGYVKTLARVDGKGQGDDHEGQFLENHSHVTTAFIFKLC